MGPCLFDRLGEEFFVALVDAFYRRVAHDAVLRPMYEEDLAPARAHLAAFLVEVAGGPARYQATRGEPRLRLRHRRFAIDAEAAETWLSHMDASLEEVGCPNEERTELHAYFASMCRFLVNRGGLALTGAGEETVPPGAGPGGFRS